MTPRCTLAGISKRYGRVWALTNVTFAVAAGEIVGLVGPNGAGKTTLLRIVAGLMRQQAGTVQTPGAGDGAIRYFGGERTLPPDVPVAEWRRLWGLDRDSRAGRKRVGALSRGMRQKLGLETVLVRPAAVALVLLDEPWEGLDPDAASWLSHALRAVRSANGAAIVSSHRIHDLAAICDRCVFMNLGRIVREVDFDASAVANRSALLLDAFEQSKGTGVS